MSTIDTEEPKESRYIAAGTVAEPHGFVLDISFGTTLPEHEHTLLREACIKFAAGMGEALKLRHPTAGITSTVHECNLVPDESWSPPNVH